MISINSTIETPLLNTWEIFTINDDFRILKYENAHA